MTRRAMLFLGMGASLIASHACAADERDQDGLTPLMWAARFGAVDAMAVLLDAGADPNGRDARNRWTPLLHAIHRQQPAAVRLLLAHGADPNAASPGNVTPLMMAADDRDPSTVRLLLAHGADADALGPGGRTALTQAVSGGALTDLTDRPLLGGCHPDTVRALIEHDPALRLPDNFAGRQALWWARFHRCEAVLKMLGERSQDTPLG